MIAGSQSTYLQAPWYLLFPSLALFITTLAFNLLGDGLRDALDPRAARVLARK
jgi:ABC-type dipeptide/oligopeptide/nickel transport system permease subunit